MIGNFLQLKFAKHYLRAYSKEKIHSGWNIMYITSVTWTVFHNNPNSKFREDWLKYTHALNKIIIKLVSNTVTIWGNSVKSKKSWLYNLDRTEYNSFSVSIMLTKSAEELIEFLCLYISAHRDMATHCWPAFAPNSAILPWEYGAEIVLLKSITVRGPGFFLHPCLG